MDYACDSNSQAIGSFAQTVGIVGSLVGYVGADIATVDVFERLLWPQRFWNGPLGVRNAMFTILFMPMGGPLFRAAFQALDGFLDHGLFRGKRQGHMLGTAFFHDSKLAYTAWLNGEPIEHDSCRNNLWTRAAALVAIPETLPPVAADKSKEAGIAPATTIAKRPTRARTSLNHIKLEQRSLGRPQPAAVVIDSETSAPSPTVYAYVFLSELTAVAAGAAVAWYHQRPWLSLLWLAPLLLKLIATRLALPREGLLLPAAASSSGDDDAVVIKTYEIHDPRHGIFLLEGTDAAVLQFFRHYGHPRRDARAREVALLAVVAALGAAWPLGLACAVLGGMPVGAQRLWLAYQAYVCVAMLVYRFAGGASWGSTERAVAEGFEECRRRGVVERVELRGERGGGEGGAVVATLTATYYDNLRDAQRAAERMLGGSGGKA